MSARLRCAGLVALLALGALGLIAPASAQGAGAAAPTADLTGRVSIMPEGAPPAQVLVELYHLPSDTSFEVVSDSTGRFEALGLPPGTYELAAQDGGRRGHRYITLLPGPQRTELRLALPRHRDLATAVWSLLALLLTAAFGAAIMMYGRARRASEQSAPASLTVALLLWMMAFLLFRAIAPEMQPMATAVASILSSIIAATLAVCVVVVLLGLRPPWTASLAALAAGLLLAFSSQLASADPGAGATEAALVPLGIGVGLLIWTTAAGVLLSLGVRKKSYLVMAAVAVAVADTYSVFFGSTRAIVTSDAAPMQALADILTLPWPILGSDLVHGVIGAGDFIFLALFLAAALRFQLGLERNFAAMLAAFVVGILSANALVAAGVIDVGLPALPFLSAFFLAVNRGRFEVERKEWLFIVVFVAALLAVFQIDVARRRRAAPETAAPTAASAPAPPEDAPAPVAPTPWDRAPLAPPDDVTRGPAREVDGALVEPVSWPMATPDAGRWTARALLARPVGAGDAPGVLVLPGRPDDDLEALALGWARRGNAAAALDWLSEREGATLEEALLRVEPTEQHSLLYRGGAAALRALGLLRPDAPERALLVGDGWGGVLAVGLAAAQPELAGLVITNAGVLADGEGAAARGLRGDAAELWLRAFGPGARAEAVTAPALVAGATNDPRFDLPSVVRLHDRLASRRKRLVLEPNQERFDDPATVAAWADHVLADGPPPPPTPQVQAEAVEGHLRLRLQGVSRLGTRGVTFFVGTGNQAWPGRYWHRLPARRTQAGDWEVTVDLSAPALRVAVLAEAVDTEGLRSSARPRVYDPADLGVAVDERPWPSPTVASWSDHDEGWRAVGPAAPTARRLPDGVLTLEFAPPLEGPRPVVLVSNHVGALRRLGARATAVRLRLDPGATLAPLKIAFVERYGEADEARAVATFTPPTRGWQWATLPVSWFVKPPPRRRDIAWPLVTAMVIETTTQPSQPLRLDAIELNGPEDPGVRRVDLP